MIPTTFPLYDDDDDLQYGECQTRDCKSNNITKIAKEASDIFLIIFAFK